VAGLLEHEDPDVALEAAVTLKHMEDERGEAFFGADLENRDRAYDRLRERFPTWEAVLEVTEDELAADDPDEPAIGLLNLRGVTMTRLHRHEEAQQALAAAISRCERTGDPLALARTELNRAHLERRCGRPFAASTPFYRYRAPTVRGSFVPAIALPEMLATIADICANPDHEVDLQDLEVDLASYIPIIRHWNSLDELTYQVLLVNGVINLGSSATELARYTGEVCKARRVAERISGAREGV